MYAIIKNNNTHVQAHTFHGHLQKKINCPLSILNCQFRIEHIIYIPTQFSPRSKLLIVQTTISCALPCQLRISNQ